jgi:hypothetical protein
MALTAGTLSKGAQAESYTKSMAKAMEKAFRKEWSYAMSGSELPPTSDDMRLLFVAIAQGVVEHLKERASSFEVTVASASGTGAHTHSTTVKIK